eukprot:CAMPEP_0114603252 /NCGR_PEP_ID=MMETSP0125-20121206/25689_1 /TAXON_ID=485358 ORGANISM="Aristerostoma sp., Strain ATCC 50986" /NCGR_SAMPLE_ID=MMETSP0125 /ASSEMBLY_ACC=CAM_ASM_000245 /LENGTH=79 /DNA_ID=CAMNT_0001813931 /DNA_START=3432 /DNA_END=3671 /DNA_ORIENTATION=+
MIQKPKINVIKAQSIVVSIISNITNNLELGSKAICSNIILKMPALNCHIQSRGYYGSIVIVLIVIGRCDDDHISYRTIL